MHAATVEEDTRRARLGMTGQEQVTTLRSAGFDDLAVAAEQERDRTAGLVDRIYRDIYFRQAVEQDPMKELSDWGLPEVALEPVLLMAGAPDEVVQRVTAEVEAHLSVRKPATVAAVAAVLGSLAFALASDRNAGVAQGHSQPG